MPHATLAEFGARELVAFYEKSRDRRLAAQRRYKIETDGYRQEALQHIHDTFRTAAAKTEIAKFLSLTTNVQRRMTDRIATPLYRRSPRRFIDNATPEEAQRYASMFRESKWQPVAKQWARYAFIGNVVFVVPRVWNFRGVKTLRLHLVTAGIADALRPVHTGADDVDPNEVSILIWQSGAENGRPIYQVVDSLAWYQIGGLDNQVSLITQWSHGEVPVTQIRLWEPPPTDWWDRTRGERLPEVTMHAARVQSLLHWVRKEQSRNILVYRGEDGPPGDQTAMPEVALSTGKRPEEANVDTVDYNLDPAHAITELRFLVEQAAESYSVPSTVVDWNIDNYNQGLTTQGHIALSEVRDDMIETVEPGELDLSWRASLQMKSAGHPEAPDPAVVKDRARIQFPPLSFVDNPKARLENHRERLSMGLTTHAKVLLDMEPALHETEEKAHAEILSMIEKRNEVNRLLADRNQTLDPTREQEDLTQRQGRDGGLARAAAEDSDPEKADEANERRQRTDQRRRG